MGPGPRLFTVFTVFDFEVRQERMVEPIVEWGCAFYKGYRRSWAWGSTGDMPVTLAEIAVEHK